ncbi:MAG: hypothetical protein FWC55_09355, partial [Firmicutes bacterium]|nr:hypothetical protein [Bacillota bacterium]
MIKRYERDMIKPMQKKETPIPKEPKKPRARTIRFAPDRRTVVIICCAAVIIAGAAVAAGLKLRLGPSTVVAWVNGEPLTYGEYSLFMTANRSKISSDFLARGAKNGANFWNTAFEGQTPFEALKQSALNDAA